MPFSFTSQLPKLQKIILNHTILGQNCLTLKNEPHFLSDPVTFGRFSESDTFITGSKQNIESGDKYMVQNLQLSFKKTRKC
jgi:hypothetical protein